VITTVAGGRSGPQRRKTKGLHPERGGPAGYQVMFGGDPGKTEHPELPAAGSAAFGELLGPMWSLVHGIAALASAGDLKQVGIEENPEDLVARAVARGLQVGQ
jgi:hypothetical protein